MGNDNKYKDNDKIRCKNVHGNLCSEDPWVLVYVLMSPVR